MRHVWHFTPPLVWGKPEDLHGDSLGFGLEIGHQAPGLLFAHRKLWNRSDAADSEISILRGPFAHRLMVDSFIFICWSVCKDAPAFLLDAPALLLDAPAFLLAWGVHLEGMLILSWISRCCWIWCSYPTSPFNPAIVWGVSAQDTRAAAAFYFWGFVATGYATSGNLLHSSHLNAEHILLQRLHDRTDFLIQMKDLEAHHLLPSLLSQDRVDYDLEPSMLPVFVLCNNLEAGSLGWSDQCKMISSYWSYALWHCFVSENLRRLQLLQSLIELSSVLPCSSSNGQSQDQPLPQPMLLCRKSATAPSKFLPAPLACFIHSAKVHGWYMLCMHRAHLWSSLRSTERTSQHSFEVQVQTRLCLHVSQEKHRMKYFQGQNFLEDTAAGIAEPACVEYTSIKACVSQVSLNKYK